MSKKVIKKIGKKNKLNDFLQVTCKTSQRHQYNGIVLNHIKMPNQSY